MRLKINGDNTKKLSCFMQRNIFTNEETRLVELDFAVASSSFHRMVLEAKNAR